MAITSLPAPTASPLLNVYEGLAEFLTPSGSSYSGIFRTITNSIVESVTLRLGPTPSEAIIHIPISEVPTPSGGHSPIYTASVYNSGISPRNAVAPFKPRINGDINLWSKVRIWAYKSGTLVSYDDGKLVAADGGDVFKLFVGYVIKMEYFGKGQEYTGIRLHCKDARELLRWTPAQGVLHYDPEDGKTTYIRDAEPIFNEGRRPNRFHDNYIGFFTSAYPRFINPDYGRFLTSQDPLLQNFLIGDDADVLDTLTRDHARKWLPGHVFNYFRNSIYEPLMLTAGTKLYQNPETGIVEEIPPLRDEEIEIPLLKESGNPDDTFEDFWNPRAVIGSIFQTGAGEAVSGIGEFAPNGISLNEVFFEICRRVGNYTLCAIYDDEDKMHLIPIRTTKANHEEQDLPVGFRQINDTAIVLHASDNANTNTLQTNVTQFKIVAGSESYATRFHMKAGPQFVQFTFTTFGLSEWTDHLEQKHFSYSSSGNVPAAEWKPRDTKPTLIPGWTLTDQRKFIQQYIRNGDTELYPDVFRTWIVPLTGEAAIDWIYQFDQPDVIGYRRMFARNRELLDRLVVKIFDTNAGIFRARPVNLPITIARCFRGIRTDRGGATAYGNFSTENDEPFGKIDWYFTKADVALLSDGRIGIQFGLDARNNSEFAFENHAEGVPAGSGNTSSPWTWNGVSDDPDSDTTYPSARSYDMMITLSLKLDEDLWQQINYPVSSERSIRTYGPVLEMYRDAGNEYGTEEARHSMFQRQGFSGVDKLADTPPVVGNGLDDEKRRIYRDDSAEVNARTRIMANRHAVTDGEYELHMENLKLSLQAGDYFEKVKTADDSHLRINALISSITHDFITQQSTIQLSNIR